MEERHPAGFVGVQQRSIVMREMESAFRRPSL
jgi:hypothetical protein